MTQGGHVRARAARCSSCRADPADQDWLARVRARLLAARAAADPARPGTTRWSRPGTGWPSPRSPRPGCCWTSRASSPPPAAPPAAGRRAPARRPAGPHVTGRRGRAQRRRARRLRLRGRRLPRAGRASPARRRWVDAGRRAAGHRAGPVRRPARRVLRHGRRQRARCSTARPTRPTVPARRDVRGRRGAAQLRGADRLARGTATRRGAALGPLPAIAARFPRAAGSGLAVAAALLSGPAEIAIVGPPGDSRTAALHRAALEAPRPAPSWPSVTRLPPTAPATGVSRCWPGAAWWTAPRRPTSAAISPAACR